MSSQKPVLIIGAGLVGLILAHGLKKAGIPFQLFEREASISSRNQGWAITIHWALPFLRELLTPETLNLIDECQVDPEVGRNDTGNFLFINLETLEPKFRIPPNERKRVRREKLREVLLKGVKEHVQWSMRLVDVHTREGTEDVIAVFENGKEFTGSLLVGAEGSKSRTRQFLRPDAYKNEQLPIRFIGLTANLSPAEVQPLRDLDPLLFQGCHPSTGTFLWVSLLETPELNGSKDTEEAHYLVQIGISWHMSGPADEVKCTNEEKLAQMKQRAQCFAPSLRQVIHGVAETTPIQEIGLADWPCLDWATRTNVTLAGDAAHAMTMYRGEAANHGILDALLLCRAIEKVHDCEMSQAQAVREYEREMRERTRPAVLLSRQACFDAHDWGSLNEDSAILKRRQLNV